RDGRSTYRIVINRLRSHRRARRRNTYPELSRHRHTALPMVARSPMLSPDSVSGFSQVSAGSARAKALARALTRPELQGPILTAIGYFIAAKVGAALAFPAAPVSAFWAPNAILFAALLLAPTRTWWRYLAAVLPLHVLAQIASTPPEQIVIQYLANAAEALIGATALIRYEKRPIRLDTL